MSSRSRAIKVGYSVITVVTLLLVVVVGWAVYLELKYRGTLFISFPTIGSLHLDDKLTIKGISYGKIENMNFSHHGRAIVDVKLSQPVKIYEGYKIFVGDKGIFGDRVIYLENGPIIAPVIARNDTLKGVYYHGIPELLGAAYKLRNGVERIRDKFHELYADSTGEGNFFAKFADLVEDSEKLINRIYSISETFSSMRSEVLDSFMLNSKKIQKDVLSLEKEIAPAVENVESFLSFGDETIDNLNLVEEKSQTLLTSIEELDSLIEVDSVLVEIDKLKELFKTIYSDAHNLRLILVKDEEIEK